MAIEPSWPPSDIAPDHFFTSWLPAEVARLRSLVDQAANPDLTANVTLTGDGGGTWTLRTLAGELAVETGDDPEAHVDAELSVADWRALIDPTSGLVPANTSGAELLLAGPLAEQAKTARGALTLRIPEFAGRQFEALVRLGRADQPATIITVDFETYTQLRDGTLAPPAAYFAGKILMEGDTAFAMQLAMSMMAGNAA